MVGLDREWTESVVENVDPAQKLLASIPSGLQLDRLTTYFKLDGRTTHGTALPYFDCLTVVLGRGVVRHHLAVRWHTNQVKMLVMMVVMMMITTCTAGSIERRLTRTH